MYDYKFTKNIKYYCNNNPELAIKMLESYLEQYPRDYYNISLYINTLIKVGMFEKAYHLCNKVESEIELERKRNAEKVCSKLEHVNASILTYKLKYYMYKKQYKIAFDFIIDHKEELIKDEYFSLCSLRIFCMRKLGLPINLKSYYNYILRQIIDYSEEDFIEHEQKHLMFDEAGSSPETDKFSVNFPFEKVYEEIKSLLPNNQKIYNGFFDNFYYFKYDNCGKNNGDSTNYFAVCTFHDTNDFITMYPVKNAEGLPYIDLNYMQKEDEQVTRKLSRLELFNKKYNLD